MNNFFLFSVQRMLAKGCFKIQNTVPQYWSNMFVNEVILWYSESNKKKKREIYIYAQ